MLYVPLCPDAAAITSFCNYPSHTNPSRINILSPQPCDCFQSPYYSGISNFWLVSRQSAGRLRVNPKHYAATRLAAIFIACTCLKQRDTRRVSTLPASAPGYAFQSSDTRDGPRKVDNLPGHNVQSLESLDNVDTLRQRKCAY